MSKHNELVGEKRLVELAIEDEEIRFTIARTLQQKEKSERRLLDYERHLKEITRKLEFDEVG